MENGSVIRNVEAQVKWFNEFKGYGFVETNKIHEDIFLHFSVVDQAGLQRVNSDDIIACDIEQCNSGCRVTKIHKLIHSRKQDIDDGKTQQMHAIMRWFNPSKGFGFAQLDSGEDVFIHANLLKKYKLEKIGHGQPIQIIAHRTNLGYEAIDLIIENDM